MQLFETSLKRLRVDSLDLVQLHHVTDDDDVKAFGGKGGVIAAIRKLQDQKIVRFIGLTGHPDAANVKKALEMYEWDTFMCFVNPAKFSRPAMEEQLPLAAKKQMGIIAMKTFGGRPGLLVGKDKGQADAATLLRYALGQDISVAIPGVSTLAQLDENLKVARDFKPLTKEEIASLTEKINAKADGWKR
jgi:predicted aldo/keto reductase-like oxidoreductase